MDLRKNCYILKMMRLMAIFIFDAVFWMTQSSIALGEIVDSDCHALKLKAAQGVPQSQIHTYEFSGTCNINALLENGPKVEKTVPVVAQPASAPSVRSIGPCCSIGCDGAADRADSAEPAPGCNTRTGARAGIAASIRGYGSR
jgi:hypothetical protein